LILFTISSLILSNSAIGKSYIHFWHTAVLGHPIEFWIDDGLMTLFFLLIGLELEREIYQGELSTIRNASLPIFGALGGMIVPAGLFLILNFGTVYQSGAGIPMATDIAFAIGILSLLGNRVPSSLRIFLTALAIIDDLGAIFVIAVFYTASLSFVNLFIALAVFSFLLYLRYLKVFNLIPYLIGGLVIWYFMFLSGIHPTLTGVLLAFAIPFTDGKEKSPSFILQHALHKPVAYFILPLFAAANMCIAIGVNWRSGLMQTNSLGIIAGLVIGKPLGIWLFSLFGVILGLSNIPQNLDWKHIIGVGLLGGVGFTMSIFITLLAFNNAEIVNNSKIAILVASIAAGIIGSVFLKHTLKKSSEDVYKN